MRNSRKKKTQKILKRTKEIIELENTITEIKKPHWMGSIVDWRGWRA